MELLQEGKKICKKCGVEKTLSEFNKDSFKNGGYYSMCKSCKRKYRISPEYKKRESELEKTPRYRSRHNKKDHVDRSSLPKEVHTLTYDEWEGILQSQQYSCAICGCQDKPLERDCIIPISKGGTLSMGNVQALCQPCNGKKGSSLPKQNPLSTIV